MAVCARPRIRLSSFVSHVWTVSKGAIALVVGNAGGQVGWRRHIPLQRRRLGQLNTEGPGPKSIRIFKRMACALANAWRRRSKTADDPFACCPPPLHLFRSDWAISCLSDTSGVHAIERVPQTPAPARAYDDGASVRISSEHTGFLGVRERVPSAEFCELFGAAGGRRSVAAGSDIARTCIDRFFSSATAGVALTMLAPLCARCLPGRHLLRARPGMLARHLAKSSRVGRADQTGIGEHSAARATTSNIVVMATLRGCPAPDWLVVSGA